ncbi:MAG: hypothetical protein IJK02_07405 [Clostridia bacterium]|nr:hypothetical protein [Clostridia bacterium]
MPSADIIFLAGKAKTAQVRRATISPERSPLIEFINGTIAPCCDHLRSANENQTPEIKKNGQSVPKRLIDRSFFTIGESSEA